MSDFTIFQAALLGDKELVLDLVREGADINAINDEGFSPLLLALEKKYIKNDFIQFLIDGGADINFSNKIKNKDYGTLLDELEPGDNTNLLDEKSEKLFSGLDDFLKATKELLKNMPALPTHTNISALKLAIDSGNLKRVKLLLNAGCNINYKNEEGLGALHNFCHRFSRDRSSEMVSILSELLEGGCCDFGENRYCESAIRSLVSYGHLEGIKLLIKYGSPTKILSWSTNHLKAINADLAELINTQIQTISATGLI